MGAPAESEVVVIGSGFGGAVAALRFANAGFKVTVLERGDRVTRARFQADLDILWKPHRAAYGCNDLRFRGRNIMPWLGAAVGGGSHVYAGTLKRRESFDGFPAQVRASDMTGYYDVAEAMLAATPYPDYPPYSDVPVTKLMFRAGAQLRETEPHLVEDCGPIRLGISFAPKGGTPGSEFVNQHGAKQRYYDPREQSALGGDIDTKNTLDRNYLHLAEKAGAVIEPLCEADRIERRPDGKWAISYQRHRPSRGWPRFRQRWLTLRPRPRLSSSETIVAKHVVVACGAVGSSELLLRNRDVHKTLTRLSPTLGTRYTTNGDYVSGMIPRRLLVPIWLAFLALMPLLLMQRWIAAAVAAGLYYLGLLLAGAPHDPDLGPTNSDFIRFRGPKGEPQYAYIESGRYPTPGRMLIAIAISALTGRFQPTLYRRVAALTKLLRFLIPPFGAIALSWPIPLLTMGRDKAYGRFSLGEDERAVLDYDIDRNADFYRYLDGLGMRVARAANAYWMRNPTFVWWKKQEVPHNQGGVPMAETPREGVVDHAGRVFGETDLLVLDGSIIPESVGPNPALTITAIAERAMAIVLAQLESGSSIIAEDSSAPVTQDSTAAPGPAPQGARQTTSASGPETSTGPNPAR